MKNLWLMSKEIPDEDFAELIETFCSDDIDARLALMVEKINANSTELRDQAARQLNIVKNLCREYAANPDRQKQIRMGIVGNLWDLYVLLEDEIKKFEDMND